MVWSSGHSEYIGVLSDLNRKIGLMISNLLGEKADK